jgi:hypothetical protein
MNEHCSREFLKDPDSSFSYPVLVMCVYSGECQRLSFASACHHPFVSFENSVVGVTGQNRYASFSCVQFEKLLCLARSLRPLPSFADRRARAWRLDQCESSHICSESLLRIRSFARPNLVSGTLADRPRHTVLAWWLFLPRPYCPSFSTSCFWQVGTGQFASFLGIHPSLAIIQRFLKETCPNFWWHLSNSAARFVG